MNRTRRKRLLAETIVLLVASPLLSKIGVNWTPQSNGVEVLNSATKIAHVEALRIDPMRFSITIVNPVHALTESPSQSSYSLAELASAKHPVVLMNAGATASFDFPAPVGLLRENDKTTSPLNKSSHGGVFCILQNGTARLFPVTVKSDESDFRSCTYAVQANPMLIEDGNISSQVHRTTGSYVNRTVIGLDDAGRVLLLVWRNIDIYDLANELQNHKDIFGLISALNMDGSSSSGLMYRADSTITSAYHIVGEPNSLIGSGILVFPHEQGGKTRTKKGSPGGKQ